MLNIAAYRFVALDELPALRERLLRQASALGLKGTILLAPEGINLSLCGAPEAVRGWLGSLEQDPRFAALEVKESPSDFAPFQRLKVRIKREIIRMDRPEIRPGAGRAPTVAPETLARWLDRGADDNGRPLVMLDTRNAFEVDAGRFQGALDWRLARFSEFPERLAAHRDQLIGKTVVSYCTGGIRCEKAALWMQAQGLTSVHQLDGGILGYFERVGARHFEGHCVVFDERGAVNAALQPAPVRPA